MDDAERREELRGRGVDVGDMPADPMTAFTEWYELGRQTDVVEKDAVMLATASADGVPSVRVVLLRGLDATGFTFYTNYESAKGRDLAANPRAALLFYWDRLARQVRVRGTVAKVERAVTEAYFAKRPRGSQISAWASPQSGVVDSREALDARFDEVAIKYEGVEVPAPPFWGGYRLELEQIEFWQGREARLHDRIRYRKRASGWTIERLAP